MYRFDLTESYIPAQTDDVVLETTVGGRLRDMAARRGECTALVEVNLDGENGRRWTYAGLLADSERLGKALASRFAPGERLVVWAPNVPEWVLMEYACGFAGLILVTANPSYQTAELRYVLEQSGASALFSVESYRGNPMAEIAVAACDGLAAVREIVDLDDHGALYRIGDRPAELPEVTPDDAAQIQYTSGTTGFPKGAVLSHRSLTNNARYCAIRAGTRPDSVWANFMPMFHTSGCGLITLGALQAGCAMYLVKLFDPAAILGLIEREKVTAILGVPTMARRDDGMPRPGAVRPLVCRDRGFRRFDGGARTGAQRQGTLWLRIRDRLRPDRGLAPRHHAPSGREPRHRLQHGGPADAADGSLDPQRGRRESRDAGRRGRRDLHARLLRDDRLSRQPLRRLRTPSTRTAGCTPAISARSTGRAICALPGG